MWKNYALDFIRKNRASSISIVTGALISSLFLSLICGLFFNFWTYEVEKIVLEEGEWQARLTGNLSPNDLDLIHNFENVEKAEVNKKLSSEKNETVIDITFRNPAGIYEEMPLLAEKLGLDDSAVTYHELLLSRYLIHDPQDEEPPLLMTFYLIILVIVSFSLILIIHNSFAASVNVRVHQFGIFSSIGAAPGQIRTCLVQEAAALCVIPVLLGNFLGIVLCSGTLRIMNYFAADTGGRHEAVFQYHPLIFSVSILSSAVTVLISAWIPAWKLSRMTPLQAIQNTGEPLLKKKKHSRMLSFLFGIEGELAGNALKARRKALRTSALSLTLSFMGFTLMLCFFTLSEISTSHTYFERYQKAWDVMITVKNTEMEQFKEAEKIRALQGVRSCIVYQKALAAAFISEDKVSREVKEAGGLKALAQDAVVYRDGVYVLQVPVIIMDDGGFTEYCEQIGISPQADGSILLNRIWNSADSNFRYKEYIPYIDEGDIKEQNTVTLQNARHPENTAQVPILACTQEPPLLREEYENYALVQFMPLSVWEKISGQIGNTEADIYIRILSGTEKTAGAFNELETDILQILNGKYQAEGENRIQEKLSDDQIRKGFMMILGAFCGLLAMIGIANVFSNTSGFLLQRKREFARYMSIGMTPESMRKMFLIEVLVIAGRPVLITLPLTALSALFMIRASYLDPVEFLEKAPVLPVAGFILAIFGFVGLAYYMGGRKILRCNLSDILRNDTMV